MEPKHAECRSAIAAMRRRLEKLELVHLREHAAELAEKLESAEKEMQALRGELESAERWAESWRDDCLRVMEEQLKDGDAIGLAKDGSLHIVNGGDA